MLLVKAATKYYLYHLSKPFLRVCIRHRVYYITIPLFVCLYWFSFCLLFRGGFRNLDVLLVRIFVTTVNDFWAFPAVARSSVLDVDRFLYELTLLQSLLSFDLVIF